MKVWCSRWLVSALCAAAMVCVVSTARSGDEGAKGPSGKKEGPRVRVRSDGKDGGHGNKDRGDFKRFSDIMRIMMKEGKGPRGGNFPTPMMFGPTGSSSRRACDGNSCPLRKIQKDIEEIRETLERMGAKTRAARCRDHFRPEHLHRPPPPEHAERHEHHEREMFHHHAHPIRLLLAPIILVCLIMHILLAVWVYTDVKKRDGSGFWVAIVLLSGFPGAILYALVRIGNAISDKSSSKK